MDKEKETYQLKKRIESPESRLHKSDLYGRMKFISGQGWFIESLGTNKNTIVNTVKSQ